MRDCDRSRPSTVATSPAPRGSIDESGRGSHEPHDPGWCAAPPSARHPNATVALRIARREVQKTRAVPDRSGSVDFVSTPDTEQDFFAELKRRGVSRVATMYAVVAWLIVQMADATFDVLGVPEAAHRILILVAAAGFPVAIALGWIFD